jgi:metallo-beta-lactamase family protein
MSMTLKSLGGAGTVTGSKHLLQLGDKRILIDCGLFQGIKVLRERNWLDFPVDPQSIDAIILTHAHLDHSGYLPRLVRQGYKGPIYCSSASADLCEILLKDSAYIAEKDAHYAKRYTKRKHPLPIYTEGDVDETLKLFHRVDFDSDKELPGNIIFKLRHAGHILGAATVEVRWQGQIIIFSGDLGRYDDPFMFDPVAVKKADYVVIESTYGDRTHAHTDPEDILGKVIDRTVQRGGTLVIPAFAVGRAQLILYYLWRLTQAGRIGNIPIFLDSPMAINATDLLCKHMDDHRLEPDICMESCAIATYTRQASESKALANNQVPKIIIAASGMLTGGRVLHHVKSYGPDPRNTILFAGYQAMGTRGAKLLGGAKAVKIFGDIIDIRAEITHLPALSAHGDCNELLRWLGGFEKPPKRTFIVHGEPAASDALRYKIKNDLNWRCSVVDPTRSYQLAYERTK